MFANGKNNDSCRKGKLDVCRKRKSDSGQKTENRSVDLALALLARVLCVLGSSVSGGRAVLSSIAAKTGKDHYGGGGMYSCHARGGGRNTAFWRRGSNAINEKK